MHIWDPAYSQKVNLQRAFGRRPVLIPEENSFKQSMSKVRISVERLFGDILNNFKFVDLRKNLKIGLSEVGKIYTVSALFRNAITCLHGNYTSFFD